MNKTIVIVGGLIGLLSLLCCSTRREATSQRSAYSRQYPKVAPTPLSKIKLVKTLRIDTASRPEVRVASQLYWKESDGSDYRLNLSGLDNLFLTHRSWIYTAEETLSNKPWMSYLERALSELGVTIGELICSIPGELLLFRGREPEAKRRVVDCLVNPYPRDKSNPRVPYSASDYYISENVAEREILEEPELNRVLVLDHFRDRNREGDLKILYILQGEVADHQAFQQQNGFSPSIKHRCLGSRTMTYEYIRDYLSPVSRAMLKSTRYKAFRPRNEREQISPRFFSSEED